MRIRRIAYSLGAEVTGVELARPFGDATMSAIRQAWAAHLLLVFPDQELSVEQLVAFSERIGPLERQPLEAHHDSPYVWVLTNEHAGTPRSPLYGGGALWHSDKSFTTTPTSATLLSCKAIPAVGGDTVFANMYAAYDSLSEGLKRVVDGLEAVHEVPRRRVGLPGTVSTAQPVVRMHPETGRPALFLGYRAKRVVGMTEDESRPLLSYLNDHATGYEFCYRHRWRVNDLVMWDNRCTLHIPLRDYDPAGQPRCMHLTAVVGSPSGRPIEPQPG